MFSVKDRDVVIPGQLLGEKIRHDENCFDEGDRVFSAVRGMARTSDNTVSVIPITGPYLPRRGDIVIGVVTDVGGSFWILDIGTGANCILRAETVSRDRNPDMKGYFDVGDAVSMKVDDVNEINDPVLSGPRKLTGGSIITVNPMRIPRILGKKRSMIDMIKNKTNSRISVGQNGRIWIGGEDTQKVVNVIKTIEREAHTSGLTNRISAALDRSD